jgi:hypothetical protein
MSHFTNALRAAMAVALMGSLACLGTATAAADPTTGNSSDVNTLSGSLSKGYNLNNCKSTPLTEKGELAEIQCGQSPDSSGPATAQYALFSNGNDLAATFNKTVQSATMTGCGTDVKQSPGTWSQGGSQGGQLACFTTNNQAGVTWTIDSKNVIGLLMASNGDVNSLYKWWQSNA